MFNSEEISIGKKVGRRFYFHVDYLHMMPIEIRNTFLKAQNIINLSDQFFNVIRVDQNLLNISLLKYDNFFEDPFPRLAQAYKVNLSTGSIVSKNYARILNPPILHRKELLIDKNHINFCMYRDLTIDLETIGAFDNPSRIGTLNFWNCLLQQKGYEVNNHRLSKISNPIATTNPAHNYSFRPIIRWRTALSRNSQSYPVSQLIESGILTPETKFFDYGCGRGDDIRILTDLGYKAIGWDPHFAPNTTLENYDIVNLGYVLNVIEDIIERNNTLRKSFSLCQKALVVSVMLASKSVATGQRFGDGYISSKDTFQKYYTQTELITYIKTILNVTPYSLAPGVCVIFKDNVMEGSYFSKLSEKRNNLSQITSIKRKAAREESISQSILQCDREFNSLIEQWQLLGRQPLTEEIEFRESLIKSFGSIDKALRIAQKFVDQDIVAKSYSNHRNDLLVYLAIRLHSSPSFYSSIPSSLRLNIKHYFSNFQTLKSEAAILINDAKNPDIIHKNIKQSLDDNLGWADDEGSYFFSTKIYKELPILIRFLLGCCEFILPSLFENDLIIIHQDTRTFTIIKTNNFNLSLPRIISKINLSLSTQRMKNVFSIKDSKQSHQFLYLKSRFIKQNTEAYHKQYLFDASIEKITKITHGYSGPSEDDLMSIMKTMGMTYDGDCITVDTSLPSLDDPCGSNFTYRDLIVCGDTAINSGLSNLPKQKDSYVALSKLATNVLDPVIDYFGMIILTYGFCSPELAKRIPNRIAPDRDQHCCHELNKNDEYICSRLGAAVDFIVEFEDMFDVTQWIRKNLKFDRLYFYGSDRPLHISYGPDNNNFIYSMKLLPNGRRIPVKLK
jgi:DNA phosphorothioation-associated putative methyltransferase